MVKDGEDLYGLQSRQMTHLKKFSPNFLRCANRDVAHLRGTAASLASC